MRESGIRRRQALVAGVAVLAAPGIARAQAPRVRIMLDWAFQSPNAFAIVARERGFFRDAGVDATVERGQGSGAVPVALANGTADLGYADLSPAIRFAAQNPDRGIIAVAVLHDRSPL
ncbi:MAG TPA: ABC transporter substrate-binding protein, partial [Acetobacteraceae bacterium]|nr:ABC transporter substrate-binding protein [Acetobacteraceae bacterium]